MSSTTPYAAVIFDMDGVLADSEPVYYEVIRDLLAALGKPWGEELHNQIMGFGVAETWEHLSRALQLEGPLDDLVAEYDRELCRQLALLHDTLPGVRELIDELKQRGIPYGLASSSWPGWIEAVLRGTGLTDDFQVWVSATMVQHGKPAPDVYLLAAERLGVTPERCIAIEDTPTGLVSAKAAGMLTVQVRSASTAFPPQPDAAIVLDSLLDFDINLLTPQPSSPA